MPTMMSTSGSAIALITPKEAANELKISEEWLRQRARRGEIPCVRLGDAGPRSPMRFRLADLERLQHANTPEIAA